VRGVLIRAEARRAQPERADVELMPSLHAKRKERAADAYVLRARPVAS
jgi:hypothetical protein